MKSPHIIVPKFISFCSKMKKNDVCSHTNLHTILCKFFYSCPFIYELFHENIDISVFVLIYLSIHSWRFLSQHAQMVWKNDVSFHTKIFSVFFNPLPPKGWAHVVQLWNSLNKGQHFLFFHSAIIQTRKIDERRA